ncbi:MAG: (2Fe-2S)-binding protein [Nitrosomonas sp.]|nr:(2Fe-2S)-binding protein [Nitrosomonas sp.]
MYICVCKGITDRDIHEAVLKGAVRMRDIRIGLGVSGQCGACACHAKIVLDKVLKQAESTAATSEA